MSVVALSVFCVATRASGQQAVSFEGPSAQSGTAPISLGISVSDVFFGHNTVGPYVLTWKNIEAGSESVSRGVKRLSRDIDYRVDAKTGVLTFTGPLRIREIARIDYRYDPRVASANSSGPSAATKLDLFEFLRGGLTLNALYKPNQSGGGAQGIGRGEMLLAMGSTAKLTDGSTLTGRVYLDATGGNILDRGGLQIKEDTAARYGTLSASFMRAGSGYKGPDEGGMEAGKAVLQLNAALNPIQGITASASFQQTTELPAQGEGTTVAVITQRLGGALGARTRFSAVRTDTTTSSPGSEDVNRVANRIQLDHRFDDRTQATAQLEHNATQSGGSTAVAQGATLSVRSQPTDRITLSGIFSNRLTAAGPEDSDRVKVSAEASSQLKLSAAIGDRYTKASALHTREAGFDFSPLPQFSLSGSLQMRSEDDDSAVARGLFATVKPVSFLEVSGGAKLRDGLTDGVIDPTAPDTYNVRLALSLPRNVIKVSGGYAYNPEDERGAVQRARNRNMAVQSSLGFLDVTGGYTLQEELLTLRQNSILDVSLGWRITSSTQLATTFRQAQTLEQALLSNDTYGVRLTHRIGSLLDLALSGTMTTYLRDGLETQKPDYRAEAKLGIRF